MILAQVWVVRESFFARVSNISFFLCAYEGKRAQSGHFAHGV